MMRMSVNSDKLFETTAMLKMTWYETLFSGFSVERLMKFHVFTKELEFKSWNLFI